MFGQLTQLAQFDPTPTAITLAAAPRVLAWVSLMEDQSGLEPAEDDWQSVDALPDTLMALLSEIGRVYPPVMLANARAVAASAAEVVAEVDGQPWTPTAVSLPGQVRPVVAPVPCPPARRQPRGGRSNP